MTRRLGDADTSLDTRRSRRSIAALQHDSEPAAADTASSPTNEGGLRRIPLDEIARHPLNPRGHVTGGVEDLAASIRELGVLEPILVSSRATFVRARPALVDEIPVTARWVLIAGERRVAAAAAAGLNVVPALSGDHLLSDGLDVEAMVVENVQREDLTPLQEARAYQLLVRDGLSQRAIAKRVGRNQAHISRRLALLTLPAAAQQAIEDGVLPILEARQLAESEPDVAAAAWDHMQIHHSGAERAVAAVHARRALEQERAATFAAAVANAETEGIPLVDEPEPHWPQVHGHADRVLAGDDLVGHATDTGLDLYWRRPPPSDPDSENSFVPDKLQHEFDRRADQRRRDAADRRGDEQRQKQATKNRRAAAARFAKKPPTSGLVEHLIDYVIQRAGYDTLRIACRYLDHHGEPHAWRQNLAAATPAERRRGAWAICLAEHETRTGSAHHRWGRDDETYLELLTDVGYEITDHDRARLADSDHPEGTDDD